MAQKAIPQQQHPITIQHGIAPATGNVVTMFSEKCDLLVFTPEQAVAFCIQILEGAKESKPSSVAGLTWPAQPRIGGSRG